MFVCSLTVLCILNRNVIALSSNLQNLHGFIIPVSELRMLHLEIKQLHLHEYTAVAIN